MWLRKLRVDSCNFIVATCFCLFGFLTAGAQSVEPLLVVERPSCERNRSELGILDQKLGRNDLIVILAYSGKGEAQRFADRRLFNAKTFLTKGFTDRSGRPPNTIFLGTSETAESKGYLDFVVNGKLELRFLFERNQELVLGECVLNFPYEKPCTTSLSKLLYPCKKTD